MVDLPWRYMTAERLRTARKTLGWTQKDLADHAGTHYQAVKYWERQTGAIAGYAVDRFKAALQAAGYVFAPPQMEAGLNAGNQILSRPIMLPKLCGAKNRKGTACRCLAIAGKNRCKFHGGLSTGPKTAEGKERIAQAQRLRWQCHGLSPIAESLVRAMAANGKSPERRTV